MRLKETIKKDFLEAFRNKDVEKKSVLSILNSEIKNAEIDLGSREEGLSDNDVLVVVKKSAKQRKDSITKYKEGGRPELAEKEALELEILKKYLPAELDSNKIREVVTAVISEIGAQDISEMGSVMSKSMQALRGEADGNIVREITTELLQNK